MFAQAGIGQSFAAAGASTELDQTSASERIAQQNALREILGVLLSAGYFRARIPQLAPFDKVVGGLSWGIASSGAAVDVDIFYDEDLALGQKIQLSENIIKVLRNMGCPSPLQAHQIQGSDFVACYPVIQWLVKKVLEYRKVTGDYVRMSSETHFDKVYAPFASSDSGVSDTSSALHTALKSGAVRVQEADTPGSQYITSVGERYRPARRYRRHPELWRQAMTADTRIQSCLLEFGERTVVKATVEEDGEGDKGRHANDFERKFVAMQRQAKAEEEGKRKAAVELERSMMTQMTEAKTAVSGSNVGAIVGLQSEELRRAAEEYRIKEEELRTLAESGDLMANTKMGRAAAHARRVVALQKQVDASTEQQHSKQGEIAEVEHQLAELRTAIDKAERYNARAVAEIAKLDAYVETLSPEQKTQLRDLFELYTRSTSLREQEAQFKASCKQQLLELQARLQDLQKESAVGDMSGRLAKLTGLHEEAKGRCQKARAALAERTREIARLSRLIDEIPSRTELIQYEHRFMELFELVAEKLDETKKYFAVYNMLDKKRGFLLKEESLLSSILDKFGSMKTKHQRQEYLNQCASITSTIEDTLQKQRAVLEAKKSTRDSKAAEFQQLIEAQRAYYKAVKEFQEECTRNEALQGKAQSRSS